MIRTQGKMRENNRNVSSFRGFASTTMQGAIVKLHRASAELSLWNSINFGPVKLLTGFLPNKFWPMVCELLWGMLIREKGGLRGIGV